MTTPTLPELEAEEATLILPHFDEHMALKLGNAIVALAVAFALCAALPLALPLGLGVSVYHVIDIDNVVVWIGFGARGFMVTLGDAC
jgi:uncharacterized protein (UPF0303 family)